MPEPDEQKKSTPKDLAPAAMTATTATAAEAIMDIDVDMYNSWPLDQISFASNLLSPFPVSSSEQPYSPLWAFSDAVDDNASATAGTHASSTTASATGLRISDYPLFLSGDINENSTERDVSRRFPSPLLGLVPIENPDAYYLIKERMTKALRFFKESTEQHVLAQVWAPVKNGGRYVLTTSGQPFLLDPHCNGLYQYRTASLMYIFSMDGETDGELGLPGRVFRQKMPEWTPNVQYYSSSEYPRLDHAMHYNVQGTLALPVFEPSGQSCVCVLELIMTIPKINYAPEVDKVCKALEAVNLKSSEILDNTNTQICNEGRQNALAEILGILTSVCETHKVPLAQTWVPCRHRSVIAYGGGLKKSCSSFDGSCMGQVCMSTTDAAVYVIDAHMWRFREACVEHHLQSGQGVAGRAFFSHNSCFCADITQYCKTEYPLVHYARMFGLAGCFAICLQSSYTGDDEYILEFFLPPNVKDIHEQKTLLGSLLATMRQHFETLKVASGVDLKEEAGLVEFIKVSSNGKPDFELESITIPQSKQSLPDPNALLKGGEMTQVDSIKQQLTLNVDIGHGGGGTLHADGSNTPMSLLENKKVKKPSERKRGKAEKSISLEVLQQYFSGSLKDAAKSLGVCPTTMKRICRQHGISRWPSRKINKVNRSLTKLKRVMESVQGAEGTFGLTAITTNASPLPVTVGSLSWPSNLNISNQQSSPGLKPSELQGEKNESPTCKTLGSDGQTGHEDQFTGGRILSEEEHAPLPNGFSPELGQGSNRSRTGSGSREESAGSPASHGSYQGSPATESAPPKDSFVSPLHDQCILLGGSPELVFQKTGELNLMASFSIPDTHMTAEPLEPFGGMLIEDAGSSKDLRNLCPAAADAIADERIPESSWTNPPCPDPCPKQPLADLPQTIPYFTARQETKSVTIKATYKEDIIRFRISFNSGILELREEVAKRLKLEVGSFDIKYLDDDHEWVLIACDADLQECIDISQSSDSNIIRLLVHDAMANLGSSCESSGYL
ncbi:protein NLP7-like [Tripterygium wilfordii]|uniref:Protein NLP7-like n=1 Tax=Tripterygium wilfordii TaxID=458696 RepID=A0A7J7C7M8_TRIWF|nr:protein NLP6 [Tripterygium wilfordii]KAF5729766.1 protein NLP7-like [Tripterygium wilfordii]